MKILFLWIVLAVFVGIAADRRGRGSLPWFALALVVSPLLAGVVLLVLPRKNGYGHWMLLSPASPISHVEPSPAPVTEPLDLTGSMQRRPIDTPKHRPAKR